MKKLLALIKKVLGIAEAVQQPITTKTAPAVVAKIDEEVKEIVAKKNEHLVPLEEAPKAPKKKKKYYKPKQPKTPKA